MIRKSKLKNILNKCRVCLSDEGCLTDIYTQELLPKIKELVKSTSININDEKGAPRRVCHVCLYKLELWYNFKEEFIRSNNILCQHLKEFESKTATAVKREHTEARLNSESFVVEPKKPRILLTKLELPMENHEGATNMQKFKDFPAVAKLKLEETEDTTKSLLDSTSEGPLQLLSPKIRPISGRRTNEQRMASTQRWVARKKALLAATGENDSDTSDSMNCDDIEPSPIFKSKEPEIFPKMLTPVKTINSPNFAEQSPDKEFTPRAIHSELIIDDATFVVTSKLHLSSPSALDKPVNDFHDSTYPKTENGNNNVRNDDRCRKILEFTEKTFVERCLNIEVEGTDFTALEKVQGDLANFVETEMSTKLIEKVSLGHEKLDGKMPDSFLTLEQQLKSIVEKAVRKNLEIAKIERSPVNKTTTPNYRVSESFSMKFIKAAAKSPIFQPRVILNHLECSKYIPKNNDYNSSPENFSEQIIPEKILDTIETPKNGKFNVEPLKPIANLQKDVVKTLKPKPKMMRCKKCHEVVKAINVKLHVCQLERKKSNSLIFKTSNQLDGLSQTYIKPERYVEDEFYTCFVCDKNFVDEKLLKDHLQRHCDDVSEEEKCSKLLFQCAICGKAVDSEKALDRHVSLHLFDDEDFPGQNVFYSKKQNHKTELYDLQSVQSAAMFPIESKPIRHLQPQWPKDESNGHENYPCTICFEDFCNEAALFDHINFHKSSSHVCFLCDKPFASLTDLQLHVNTH